MNENDDRTRGNPAVRTGANERATVFMGNALPVGFVFGDFEIESVIGKGGFSIVYLARDRQLNRRNALKEYMPASLATRSLDLAITVKSERMRETFEAGLRSFMNEARILAQFDHPALVKVFRFWEERGTAYMAMPYYDGVTLKQALQSGNAAPTEDWLRSLFEPLLDAIELLHGENCLHRDIAPDNIMILRGGTPLLLDFGAARLVISDMTQELTAILKPGYAPIEQYADTKSLRQGPWTDIYATAAVLYRAVTGRVPSASVGRLVNDDLLPVADAAPKGYSDRFLAGIQAGLAIKPQDRPQSIAEFRGLLGYRSAPSAHEAVAVETGDTRTPAARPPNKVPTFRDRSRTLVPKGARSGLGKPGESIAPAVPRVFWRYLGVGVVLAGAIAGAWFAVRPHGTDLHGTTPAGKGAEPVDTSLLPPRPSPETPTTPAPVTTTPATETPVAGAQPAAPGAGPNNVPPPERAVRSPAQAPTAPVANVEGRKETVAPNSRRGLAKHPTAGSFAPEPRGDATTAPTCADLLQELSIGRDTPELRAKLENLNCTR